MEVSKRVLLVEDNEINAEIAKQQLLDMGFEVEWVSNGARAVEVFGESELDYYDLVIMDLMMPVMDGIEATKIIRRLEREDAATIPIIAVTANSYSEDEQTSVSSGITRFITKPYNRDILYDTIKGLSETGV